MTTEDDWCGNEKTRKSEMVDSYFANEVFVIWFSDFNKMLCNFMFKLSRLVFSFTTNEYQLNSLF